MIMPLKEKVVKKLNDELGNEVKNLSKCERLTRILEEEKTGLEKSLSLASNDKASKVTLCVRQVEETLLEIETVNKQYNELYNLVNKHDKKVNSVQEQVQEHMDKIKLLEKAADYLKILKKIEEISGNIESGINDKNERKSVLNYVMLCDVLKILSTSQCRHLVSFINDTVHFWHNILKDKLTVDYEEVLKNLKWPFVGNNVLITPSAELLSRFQMLTEFLLQIELPHDTVAAGVPSVLLTDFKPLSLPMLLLLRPLRKRFLYHFTGDRQTNRSDKPEWFFTQVLTWIRNHQEFIDNNLQSVFNKLGRKNALAKTEFIRGLVQTVVEKLHNDIQYLQYDDSLFSHMVDETLGFDRELRDSYGYPNHEPGVIGVLTAASIFIKWLNMEKKYAFEKMDNMLSSETAFERLMASERDDYYITECGDSFLTLLSAITERYKILPQPGHKLQFLDLQLELLDDLRVRLLQVIREESDPLSGRYLDILNTVDYIHCAMHEAVNTTHFLQLAFYKNQMEKAGTELSGKTIVFEEYLNHLSNMRDDLISSVCDAVLMNVKARSRAYRKEKWFAMEAPKENDQSLSSSACPMFQVLSAHIHLIEKLLSPPLFERCWNQLAESLDQYLYEEIVAVNCFNEGGASQFHYDITRNLFPLFGQYTRKPEAKFKRLKDSITLLTLPRGSALLLKESIKIQQGEDGYDSNAVLNDIGVYTLTKDNVLLLINQRTDLIGFS